MSDFVFSFFGKIAYYGVMVVIEGKEGEMCICGFDENTPTIDFGHLFSEGKGEKIFGEYRFVDNLKKKCLKDRKVEERDAYIGCFYLLVDGKRERNGVCVVEGEVVVFGESFLGKGVKVSLGESGVQVFIGTKSEGFCGKKGDCRVYICDTENEEGEEGEYSFEGKKRVCVYKNEGERRILL